MVDKSKFGVLFILYIQRHFLKIQDLKILSYQKVNKSKHQDLDNMH